MSTLVKAIVRPRSLVVLAAAAALALPVALTTGARASSAAVTQARPVVDRDFLYKELYYLATQDIYRVAGSDGPLSNPSDPNNLPRNYNGAQEFYQWFGSELTNDDADHMGPLGRFMTAKDHPYSTRTWQLNDEIVTIPGGTCPGQIALIAGHNDSTPTTTSPNAGAVSGSSTPLPSRGGNWGNGSGYDAGSGEALGMAEMQALLRWHAANGTYPKRTLKIGLFDNEEGGLVGSGFYSQTNVTTLAAGSTAGATNLKFVNSTGVGLTAGRTLLIDPFGHPETRTISSVGGTGANGTGITVTPALSFDHPVGAPISAGIDDVGGLIPDGPQGQYVMVANMDQNGIEYPARHFGTEHYLNNIVGGGVGPWYTNINAIPLYTTPNSLYNATAIQRIQHNLANAQAFRNATADAVGEAFQVLGAKYNFSMPLENPLRFDQVGSTPVDPTPQSVPAYQQSDIPLYSPVVDDNTGRTDQVSFIRDWGIPGYGIIGAYDTSTNQAVGGNENPYPANYASKPSLGQYAPYDVAHDTLQTFNYYASGTTHGPGGVESPSEGLMRGLELPATWTSYLIAKDQYGGAEPKTDNPVAYFETDPAKPFLTSTVGFDASFSRNGGGHTQGLRYFWDFGDGTMVATTKQKVTHTFSTAAAWRDVRLVVNADDKWDFYRQAVPVRFVPAHYPEAPLANEPPPPATDPCGSLTAAEQSQLIRFASLAFPHLGGGVDEVPFAATEAEGGVGGTVPATLSLSLGPAATFGAFTPGVTHDYDAGTTANVISTAGNALLSVADGNPTATGHLVNGTFSLPSALQARASSAGGVGGALADVGGSASPTPLLTYPAPISNDAVAIAFRQHIGATDALRTGNYSKTLTFTLSTTTP